MATRRSCRHALRHAEPSFRHPQARSSPRYRTRTGTALSRTWWRESRQSVRYQHGRPLRSAQAGPNAHPSRKALCPARRAPNSAHAQKHADSILIERARNIGEVVVGRGDDDTDDEIQNTEQPEARPATPSTANSGVSVSGSISAACLRSSEHRGRRAA